MGHIPQSGDNETMMASHERSVHLNCDDETT